MVTGVPPLVVPPRGDMSVKVGGATNVNASTLTTAELPPSMVPTCTSTVPENPDGTPMLMVPTPLASCVQLSELNCWVLELQPSVGPGLVGGNWSFTEGGPKNTNVLLVWAFEFVGV